jgi:hypothetical protein
MKFGSFIHLIACQDECHMLNGNTKTRRILFTFGNKLLESSASQRSADLQSLGHD